MEGYMAVEFETSSRQSLQISSEMPISSGLSISQRAYGIAQWILGQQIVRLDMIPDQQKFCYSVIQEGLETQGRSFECSLYNIHYAANLVLILYSAIGKNLRMASEITPDCFLPILYTDAMIKDSQTEKIRSPTKPEQVLKVALFGRKAISGIIYEVKDARWAIYNELSKNVIFYSSGPITDLAKSFIIHAPTINKPHEDKKRHFQMNAYKKQFRVIILVNEYRIESVDLRRTSIHDQKFFLNEENWAVTIVCKTRTSSRCFEGERVEVNKQGVGHALLACEGVENGKQFIKYAHIQRVKHSQTGDKREAKVEIRVENCFSRLNTLNGPTWPRSRELVSTMLSKILENRDVKLVSVGGHIIRGWGSLNAESSALWRKMLRAWGLFRLYPRGEENLRQAESSYRDLAMYKNCLEWCIEALRHAKIKTMLSPQFTSPVRAVRYLNKNPWNLWIEPNRTQITITVRF